ncbi:alpha/beta fold hydrolase [Hymenobacter psychrophilus]|uniref:Pimeloyl-ACP methyl ester carboxylesterase n=1 Tax=Hymenobacter psychrophilus TaxID=651662 RepID=A0A1H3D891_9BACT|nr:alpha/beta hydrolase [Hymenobacter psychrophilus]SDX62732.1 Pimeloyl-ACP methyl ester carboxylesterase [Hymenobacter psychrophilus]
MLDTTLETVQGHRVRVARLGQGEAVVLLHGYPDNLQVFSRIAPALAVDKQVIAFDWPGQGNSAAWPGGVTPVVLARHLLTLLDAWGLPKIHLLGQDMGGQPALVFAAAYPERIHSLVVMNCLADGNTSTSWEIRWLRRFGLNKRLLRHLPWLVFQRAVHTFLPWGRPGLSAALQREMWQTFRQPAVREVVVRMCAGYEAQLPRLPARYQQVQCPTLILWGEKDKHFPPSQARFLAAQIPHGQLEIIPGAWHWMVLAQADEVVARIRKFYGALLL